MSTTSTQFGISLKGSAAIVTEYLEYAINSILFQRGVESAKKFTGVEKYGLTLMMSTNDKTIKYLRDTLHQVQKWIARNELKDIDLLIRKKHTKDIVEQWTFKVQNESGDGMKMEKGHRRSISLKSMKKIQQEISQVMRQIIGTVSFLPLLGHRCTFAVKVGFKSGCRPRVPSSWTDCDMSIRNARSVPFKSFSTGLHKVETMVMYQENDFIY